MPVLPKRGVIAAGLTALGLALLFSFKTPDKPVGTLPRPGDGGAGSGTNGTGGTGGTVSNPQPTATPATGGSADGTVAGPTVQTRFGPVQVQVTFAKGTMTDVKALQLPYDRQHSAEISSYVEPILRQEVLAAQSAQIDLISGATYTSYGYAQSVQAVLDQVHG